MTFGKTQLITFYKDKESKERISRESVLVMRLDGVGFSKLKSKFGWDKEDSLNDTFVDIMLELTKIMCDKYRPTQAFVGSDEISMFFVNDSKSEHIFGGKTHKICSIVASFCSIWANKLFSHAGMIPDDEIIMFDCRVFSVNSEENARVYMDSRAYDVHRNCMRTQASKYMSHKQLHGINSNELYAFVSDEVSGVFDDRHMNYCGHTFEKVARTIKLSEKVGDRFDDLVAKGHIKGDEEMVTYEYKSEPVTTYYG